MNLLVAFLRGVFIQPSGLPLRRRSPGPKRSSRRTFTVECLEDRTMPSTFVGLGSSDSGATSLYATASVIHDSATADRSVTATSASIRVTASGPFSVVVANFTSLDSNVTADLFTPNRGAPRRYR